MSNYTKNIFPRKAINNFPNTSQIIKYFPKFLKKQIMEIMLNCQINCIAKLTLCYAGNQFGIPEFFFG